jgi:hypothetical protein
MSLSTHPAPIVQPEAAYPISANGQTIEADEELNVLTSELLSVGALSVSICQSSERKITTTTVRRVNDELYNNWS